MIDTCHRKIYIQRKMGWSWGCCPSGSYCSCLKNKKVLEEKGHMPKITFKPNMYSNPPPPPKGDKCGKVEELQVQKVGMVGMVATLTGHGGLWALGMGGWYVHGHMVAWVYGVGLIQDINLYVWLQRGWDAHWVSGIFMGATGDNNFNLTYNFDHWIGSGGPFLVDYCKSQSWHFKCQIQSWRCKNIL